MGSLRRRLADDEGVTLVEMMVAILILGIVLTALAGTLVTSLASASRQEADIQANAVANAVVEDLRALPFRAVALCTGEASASFEGEEMVLLPSTDPQCSEAGRPLATFAVVQDGRTYDGVLAITWIDDPATAASQDYKRVVVELSWEDRDRTMTSRTEARRAPEAAEQPMSAQVDPLVTRLRDEGDGSGVTGRNDAAFYLRAVHVLEQSMVTVTWRDRTGATDSAALATSDGGFTWSYKVPFNDGLFPNGETLFTFTATSPSSETTELVTRALLLHDLEYRNLSSNGTTLMSDGSTVASTSAASVDPSGIVCALQVNAGMRGMLLSDGIDLRFSHESTTTYALSGITQTANGAEFTLDLAGTGGFPVPLADTTESIIATLTADRAANPPASPVQRSWTIELSPVLACGP